LLQDVGAKTLREQEASDHARKRVAAFRCGLSRDDVGGAADVPQKASDFAVPPKSATLP
jgi:hypothetical protein